MKECQRVVDSAEFLEWQAYDRLEPFGEDRADLRAGIMASTLANTTRRPSDPPWEPQDFMLLPHRWPKPERVQTVEEQQYILGLVAQRSRAQQTPAA